VTGPSARSQRKARFLSTPGVAGVESWWWLRRWHKPSGAPPLDVRRVGTPRAKTSLDVGSPRGAAWPICAAPKRGSARLDLLQGARHQGAGRFAAEINNPEVPSTSSPKDLLVYDPALRVRDPRHGAQLLGRGARPSSYAVCAVAPGHDLSKEVRRKFLQARMPNTKS